MFKHLLKAIFLLLADIDYQKIPYRQLLEIKIVVVLSKALTLTVEDSGNEAEPESIGRGVNKQRNEFVRACPDENCRGFLSTQWKCGVCAPKVLID